MSGFIKFMLKKKKIQAMINCAKTLWKLITSIKYILPVKNNLFHIVDTILHARITILSRVKGM